MFFKFRANFGRTWGPRPRKNLLTRPAGCPGRRCPGLSLVTHVELHAAWDHMAGELFCIAMVELSRCSGLLPSDRVRVRDQ